MLMPLIKDIFSKSRQNYGTRRIKIELKNLGHKISRKRIGKLMLEANLFWKNSRKFKHNYN